MKAPKEPLWEGGTEAPQFNISCGRGGVSRDPNQLLGLTGPQGAEVNCRLVSIVQEETDRLSVAGGGGGGWGKGSYTGSLC